MPKGTIVPDKETLIGIGTDGSWNAITVQAKGVSIKKLGSYGNSLTSSGDAFSIEGIGTFATTKPQFQFGGTDKLVQVNPVNGSTIVIGDTGVSDLWGFAWYSGKFYGFSSSGSVYELDVTTGKAKGLPPLKLLIKYPLRHAINPFVADIGHLLPEVISGSVIVSVVLSLPTTGPMLLGALKTQDVNLAATFLLIVAVLTVIGMLISDLLLALLDPRIRFGATSEK